jgi:hypothetical protein
MSAAAVLVDVGSECSERDAAKGCAKHYRAMSAAGMKVGQSGGCIQRLQLCF